MGPSAEESMLAALRSFSPVAFVGFTPCPNW